MLRFLQISIFLLQSIIVFPQNNYYVSPYGNDENTGLSVAQAWETVQKAAAVLQPGDSVFIMSGVYHEIVIPANSGTPDNYITYTVYPGDTAIIDGSTFADTYLQFADRAVFDIKDGVSYINVVGLHVRNSNATGIAARRGATHINCINNKVSQCQAPGISAGYGLPLGRGTNINAINNIVDSCALITRESISFRSVDTFDIAYNIVTNSPQLGIDAKSGCSNGRIFKNYVSNAWPGIYIDAGHIDTVYGSQHNIHVFQNHVFNCRTGIAIASESGNLGEDIWIYNNIVYDTPDAYNSRDGIVVANYEQSGPLQDIYIINNTIYGKGHRGIYINNLNVDNIVIRNNICSNNTISQIDVKSDTLTSGVILENNLIDGFSIDIGLNAVIADPLFINAAEGNFKLQANSPAINSGSSYDAPDFDYEGNSRPQGQGFDIGAFEFVSTVNNQNIKKNNTFASIHPNPASDVVFIETEYENYEIIIYDSFGRLVKHTHNKKELITNPLQSGVYFLRISKGLNIMTTKLIIIE